MAGKRAFERLKEFAGYAGASSGLVPRWIFLRAIGVVALLVFVDYLRFGDGMAGAQGVYPFLDAFARKPPYGIAILAFLKTPTLLHLYPSWGLFQGLLWAGVAGSLAVVANVHPRLALVVTWSALLSIFSVTEQFALFQHDRLILESLFLGIFFAPGGARPGLGRDRPPRPLALLALRWLLFRLMFQSGLSKILSGDPHWRDLSAMDLQQEVSPLPTFLGYLDFHLPHVYHLGQMGLLFVAEFVAPLAALTGRRGRGFAFLVWLVFQAGIELTGNYGFLNFNALALGVLLLDDQLIIGALALVRASKLARRLSARVGRAVKPAVLRGEARWLFTAPLALNLAVSATLFVCFVGFPRPALPWFVDEALDTLAPLRIASDYHLYNFYPSPKRLAIEYLGSNDGGRTWRSYEYRYLVQKLDRIPAFTAPYFTRFEATLGVNAGSEATTFPLIERVGRLLLEGARPVIGLFSADPFPDKPPDRIVVAVYQYHFTSLVEFWKTGNYWKRTYLRDYCPVLAR